MSPHLDDAVLSCFSALGPGTVVLTVFAGLPSIATLGAWDAKTGATDSRIRVAERRVEDQRATGLAGCDHVHLDFEDSQYWRRTGLKGLIKRAGSQPPSLNVLVDALRAEVEGARVVYAPAGIGNTQHSLVRDATIAIREDISLYADIPYVLGVAAEDLELPPSLINRPHRRRDEILRGERAALKVRATLCYTTQIAALESAFGPFVRSERYVREVIWDLETRHRNVTRDIPESSPSFGPLS